MTVISFFLSYYVFRHFLPVPKNVIGGKHAHVRNQCFLRLGERVHMQCDTLQNGGRR